jgi:hypothetical protein
MYDGRPMGALRRGTPGEIEIETEIETELERFGGTRGFGLTARAFSAFLFFRHGKENF